MTGNTQTQTTLAQYENAEVATDGGIPEFDPEAETVSEEWEGRFIYASLSYETTQIHLAQIVEVSDTGKTVKARLTKAARDVQDKCSERVTPLDETYGDEFRLHVRTSRDEPVFRGSYPFISGDKNKGTRRGTFSVYDKGGKGVRQTVSNW